MEINLKPTNKKITNYIQYVEEKFLKTSPIFSYFSKLRKNEENKKEKINIGDILRIVYITSEGENEKTQSYEGLLIAKQNKGLGKSFKIRRLVQGIGIEQTFLLHSPKLISIIQKQSSKVRRAKLYFIRSLKGKSIRLQQKQ